MLTWRGAVILLAWWFLFAGVGEAPPTPIGPFTSKEQCQYYLTWIERTRASSSTAAFSPCWEDGRR